MIENIPQTLIKTCFISTTRYMGFPEAESDIKPVEIDEFAGAMAKAKVAPWPWEISGNARIV